MGFTATGLLETLGTSLATAAVGAGVSSLLTKKPSLSIPPPPGAAMLDPAGSSAAASMRRRQAGAGGLQSTQTGAGNQEQPTGATSGGKTLLGA